MRTESSEDREQTRRLPTADAAAAVPAALPRAEALRAPLRHRAAHRLRPARAAVPRRGDAGGGPGGGRGAARVRGDGDRRRGDELGRAPGRLPARPRRAALGNAAREGDRPGAGGAAGGRRGAGHRQVAGGRAGGGGGGARRAAAAAAAASTAASAAASASTAAASGGRDGAAHCRADVLDGRGRQARVRQVLQHEAGDPQPAAAAGAARRRADHRRDGAQPPALLRGGAALALPGARDREGAAGGVARLSLAGDGRARPRHHLLRRRPDLLPRLGAHRPTHRGAFDSC